MPDKVCLDITKITSRNEIAPFLGDVLRKLGIDKYLLCEIDHENVTYHHLAIGTGPLRPDRESPSDGRANSFMIAGSFVEFILNSPTPLTFARNEILRKSKTNGQDDFLLRTIGRDGLLGVPLRTGNGNLGVLWVQSGVADIQILLTISSQLSLILAWMNGHEKIENQAIQIESLKTELSEVRSGIRKAIEKTEDTKIIVKSEALKNVLKLVSQVAETQSTVLLLGETGTGKELIARKIHQLSRRKNEVMITVNCAALPPNLIESELFGHEKGSYTGAVDRRVGKWELAHNGTLFLDEIGDMPTDLQAKLLRALQEREIERVGGKTVIKTDVRVIAATNKDLRDEVRLGKFRSDLFFRLNIFPITIPPLRDRKQDIPALAAYFLKKYADKSSRQITGFSNKVMKNLTAYGWPGNVRELEHLIERSVLLASDSVINELHLLEREDMELSKNNRVKTMTEVERSHIMRVLEWCSGKVAGPGGAAEALGMPPTTLHSMIKRLGIKKQYSE
jgi:formate hydrogenlyase transcriptional activator